MSTVLNATQTARLMNLVQAVVMVMATYGSATISPSTFVVKLAYALPAVELGTFTLMYLSALNNTSHPTIAAVYYVLSRITSFVKWMILPYLLYKLSSLVSFGMHPNYNRISLAHAILLFLVSIPFNVLTGIHYVDISQGGKGNLLTVFGHINAAMSVILASFSLWATVLLYCVSKNIGDGNLLKDMMQKGLRSTVAILLLAIGLVLNPYPPFSQIPNSSQVYSNAFTLGITQLVALRFTHKTEGASSSNPSKEKMTGVSQLQKSSVANH
jgi:hypothetical protein